MQPASVWTALRAAEPPPAKTVATAEQRGKVAYAGPPPGRRGAVLVGVGAFAHPAVAPLEWPLRDCELLSERLRFFQYDSVELLTSSQQDEQMRPTAANVQRVVAHRRRQLGEDGLLVVVVVSHGLPDAQGVSMLMEDFDPASGRGALRVDELAAAASPSADHRALLLADYGSCAALTLRSFPGARTHTAPPPPPPRAGLAVLLSPPEMPASLCACATSCFDELLERKLPICPNSVYAIMQKHSAEWFAGSPVVYATDRGSSAGSGRLPLVNWAKVDGAPDARHVSFSVAVSVAAANGEAPPPAGVVEGLVRGALPRAAVRLEGDSRQGFVMELNSDDPACDPARGRPSSELALVCAERRLPRAEAARARRGRVYGDVACSQFAALRQGLPPGSAFASSSTPPPHALVRSLDPCYHFSVTCSFADFAALDSVMRSGARDPQTGLRVEDVGPASPAEPPLPGGHPDGAAAAAGAPPSARAPVVSPHRWAPRAEPSPPFVHPAPEGPTSLQPPAWPQGPPAPPPASAPPWGELREERKARERDCQELRDGLAELREALRAAQRRAAEAEQSTERLAAEVARVARRVDHPPQPPQPPPHAFSITRDDWLSHQDQMRLLQVQLRDVQSALPAGTPRTAAPAPAPAAPQPGSPQLSLVAEQCAAVARRVDAAEERLREHAEAAAAAAGELRRVQEEVEACKHGAIAHADAQDSRALVDRTQRGNYPNREVERVQSQECAIAEAAGAVEALRQRVGRLEAAAASCGTERAALASRVEAVGSITDKLAASFRALQECGDVRRLYNDLVADDIDAQLPNPHSRAWSPPGPDRPSTGPSRGPDRPTPRGGAVYLPRGLREVLQQMVRAENEVLRDWAEGEASEQREQLAELNAATAEQLLQLRSKLAEAEQAAAERSAELHRAVLDRVASCERAQADCAREQRQQLIAADRRAERELREQREAAAERAQQLQGAVGANEAALGELARRLGTGLDAVSVLQGSLQMLQHRAAEQQQALSAVEDSVDAAVAAANADIAEARRDGEARAAALQGKLDADRAEARERFASMDQTTARAIEELDRKGRSERQELAGRLGEAQQRTAQELRLLHDRLAALEQQSAAAGRALEERAAELSRRWDDAEGHLKGQLRGALQEHVESLDELLGGMRKELDAGLEGVRAGEQGLQELSRAQEQQRLQQLAADEAMDGLRSAFETYVRDGTRRLLEAQSEQLEELRGGVAAEIEGLEGRVGEAEGALAAAAEAAARAEARAAEVDQRRSVADAEFETALRRIQQAMPEECEDDRLSRVLQRIIPAEECLARLDTSVAALDGLTQHHAQELQAARARQDESERKAAEHAHHLERELQEVKLQRERPADDRGAQYEALVKSLRDLQADLGELERGLSRQRAESDAGLRRVADSTRAAAAAAAEGSHRAVEQVADRVAALEARHAELAEDCRGGRGALAARTAALEARMGEATEEQLGGRRAQADRLAALAADVAANGSRVAKLEEEAAEARASARALVERQGALDQRQTEMAADIKGGLQRLAEDHRMLQEGQKSVELAADLTSQRLKGLQDQRRETAAAPPPVSGHLEERVQAAEKRLRDMAAVHEGLVQANEDAQEQVDALCARIDEIDRKAGSGRGGLAAVVADLDQGLGAVRAKVGQVAQTVADLVGWRKGKDDDAGVMERHAGDLRKCKKEIADLRDDLEALKLRVA